jgi:dienelactone hydrolase
VMGWSFGGIVTMFAVSRSNAFAVAVDQAGGALTWNGNPDIRAALTAAAQKSTTPTLLQVAENDRTTDSITTVAKILETRGVPYRMVIYPPFTAGASSSFGTGAPGHAVFSERGTNVWSADVLEFLKRYLTAVIR